jgi:hypothetical protein
MKKYLSLVIVAVAFTVSCKSTQPASATAQKTQTVKPVEAPQTTPVTPLPTPTATETATETTNNEKLKRYGKANTVNLTPEQRKQVAAMSEEHYKTLDNSDNKKAD